MQKMQYILRGHIYYFDFDNNESSAGFVTEKDRRALVVQNNIANQNSKHENTLIVPIQHDVQKGLPVHVEIPAGMFGIVKDSIIDCSKIYAIRKEDLGTFKGTISFEYLNKVDLALKISLGLK